MRHDPSGDVEVTFVENAQYETEGPGKGPIFKAGETISLRLDIAERWIRRGKAVRSAEYVAPEHVAEEPAGEEQPEPEHADEAEPEKPADNPAAEPEEPAAKVRSAAKPRTVAKTKP